MGWAGGPGRDWKTARILRPPDPATYTVHHGALPESKPRLEKATRKERSSQFHERQFKLPKHTASNKQGDSISEVELNSFKQFSGKKKKKKRVQQTGFFRLLRGVYLLCLFQKIWWKSESHTHYSWPVLKFKTVCGGAVNDIVLSRQKDAFHLPHQWIIIVI